MSHGCLNLKMSTIMNEVKINLFGETSLSIRFLKQIILSDFVDSISGTSKNRFEYSFTNFVFISSVSAFLHSGLQRTTVNWGGENILKWLKLIKSFQKFMKSVFARVRRTPKGKLKAEWIDNNWRVFCKGVNELVA